ncbi:hypothetical protein GGD40_003183 [Paraburkholderia bryophila]|uniref:Secreted protein n=1 Tax=Paraburkholderia bryophila TaxID=420952 RepID=A0A7Z0B720_9BURK|nr:hypothetical protein [Paraburkholderia bryophila]NYH23704.1 hypothetical protein [Paraburkholderia bryophila]
MIKSRTAKLAAATAAIALVAAASALPGQAQTQAQIPPDSQWRPTQTTLSTLLQDGYKIVAVVNGAHGSAGPADTIFVQRDQSAFKCIDPQQPEARTKTPTTPPVCYELVPPSGAPAPSESK